MAFTCNVNIMQTNKESKNKNFNDDINTPNICKGDVQNNWLRKLK